jgi:hypothetical protein
MARLPPEDFRSTAGLDTFLSGLSMTGVIDRRSGGVTEPDAGELNFCKVMPGAVGVAGKDSIPDKSNFEALLACCPSIFVKPPHSRIRSTSSLGPCKYLGCGIDAIVKG